MEIASQAPSTIDPEGFERRIWEYLDRLRVRQYSERTVGMYGKTLGALARWASERGVTRPIEVTKALLERYQRRLSQARKASGDPYAARSQYNQLVTIGEFFRFLARSNVLVVNPAADLELPKVPEQLPRGILSPQDVERVIAAPEVGTLLGLRDRAILELVYSTGLRRLELVEAKVGDVDPERGTIFVRKGKGAKERLVPIGERALAWLSKYLEEARPEFVRGPDEGYLIVSLKGGKLTPSSLSTRMGDYVRQALEKPGAVHVFRHAMATGMLDGGADIRYVQAMLGHARLTSTQIYTHTAIGKLQAVHRKSHPGERSWRRKRPGPGARDARGEAEGQERRGAAAGLEGEAPGPST